MLRGQTFEAVKQLQGFAWGEFVAVEFGQCLVYWIGFDLCLLGRRGLEQAKLRTGLFA